MTALTPEMQALKSKILFVHRLCSVHQTEADLRYITERVIEADKAATAARRAFEDRMRAYYS
jgi:hypothetical protein